MGTGGTPSGTVSAPVDVAYPEDKTGCYGLRTPKKPPAMAPRKSDGAKTPPEPPEPMVIEVASMAIVVYSLVLIKWDNGYFVKCGCFTDNGVG